MVKHTQTIRRLLPSLTLKSHSSVKVHVNMCISGVLTFRKILELLKESTVKTGLNVFYLPAWKYADKRYACIKKVYGSFNTKLVY